MVLFREQVSLAGRVVVITGANSGIGYETAKHLIRIGATVYLACRSKERGEAARTKMITELVDAERVRSRTQHSPAAATPELLKRVQEDLERRAQLRIIDLASLVSVRQCAELLNRELTRLDILLLNAGVGGTRERQTSVDGFEMTMACNHFGHFLLTQELLPLLKRTATLQLEQTSPAAEYRAPRVVVVSSRAHMPLLPGQRGYPLDVEDLQIEKPGVYGFWAAYSKTKQANILFTLELRKKLVGSGVVAYALHPGAVKSNLFGAEVPNWLWKSAHSIADIFLKTAWQGCQTSLYASLSRELEPPSPSAPQGSGPRTPPLPAYETSGNFAQNIYMSDLHSVTPWPPSVNEQTALSLWELSEKLTRAAPSGENGATGAQ